MKLVATVVVSIAIVSFSCSVKERLIEIGAPETAAMVDLSPLSAAARPSAEGKGGAAVTATPAAPSPPTPADVLVPIAVDKRSAEFLYVFADGTPVRTVPKGTAPSARTLKYGEKLEVLDRANGYVRIGIAAWVKRTDLTDRRKLFASPEEIWFVQKGDLTVHERPDPAAPVVGKLTSGDRFEGMRSADASEWIEISDDAYVQKDGLSHAAP